MRPNKGTCKDCEDFDCYLDGKTFRQSLQFLRSFKARAKILYERNQELMLSDEELKDAYSKTYKKTLCESERSSLRRSGRYWRSKWGFKRPKEAVMQQTHIQTFAKG